MRALHPSETASDGRPIDVSRYPAPTDPDENFIECAQCGFVMDLNVNGASDSLGSIDTFVAHSTTVTLPASGNAAVVSFTDQYADPQRTDGCPFCGSLNMIGKYRDRDGFVNPRTSIENL